MHEEDGDGRGRARIRVQLAIGLAPDRDTCHPARITLEVVHGVYLAGTWELRSLIRVDGLVVLVKLDESCVGAVQPASNEHIANVANHRVRLKSHAAI